MALATLTELKAYLDKTGTEFDAVLTAILEAASTFVERETGRQFTTEPALVAGVDSAPAVTKTFSTYGRGLVEVPDLRSVTAVTLNGTALAAYSSAQSIGYVLSGPTRAPSPFGALLLKDATYGNSTYGDLAITGRWGWNPIPPDIKDATLALAARRYKERDASYADTVADAEGGVFSYYRQLPAAVKVVLDSYKLQVPVA